MSGDATHRGPLRCQTPHRSLPVTGGPWQRTTRITADRMGPATESSSDHHRPDEAHSRLGPGPPREACRRGRSDHQPSVGHLPVPDGQQDRFGDHEVGVRASPGDGSAFGWSISSPRPRPRRDPCRSARDGRRGGAPRSLGRDRSTRPRRAGPDTRPVAVVEQQVVSLGDDEPVPARPGCARRSAARGRARTRARRPRRPRPHAGGAAGPRSRRRRRCPERPCGRPSEPVELDVGEVEAVHRHMGHPLRRPAVERGPPQQVDQVLGERGLPRPRAAHDAEQGSAPVSYEGAGPSRQVLKGRHRSFRAIRRSTDTTLRRPAAPNGRYSASALNGSS